jgi:hypothetical protein
MSLGSSGGGAIVLRQIISLGPLTDRPTSTWVFAVPRSEVCAYLHRLFEDLGPFLLLQYSPGYRGLLQLTLILLP